MQNSAQPNAWNAWGSRQENGKQSIVNSLFPNAASSTRKGTVEGGTTIPSGQGMTAAERLRRLAPAKPGFTQPQVAQTHIINETNQTKSPSPGLDEDASGSSANGKSAKKKTTGPVHNSRYKAKMCKNWIKNGSCPYFEKCQFAHGSYELEKWATRRARLKSSDEGSRDEEEEEKNGSENVGEDERIEMQEEANEDGEQKLQQNSGQQDVQRVQSVSPDSPTITEASFENVEEKKQTPAPVSDLESNASVSPPPSHKQQPSPPAIASNLQPQVRAPLGFAPNEVGTALPTASGHQSILGGGQQDGESPLFQGLLGHHLAPQTEPLIMENQVRSSDSPYLTSESFLPDLSTAFDEFSINPGMQPVPRSSSVPTHSLRIDPDNSAFSSTPATLSSFGGSVFEPLSSFAPVGEANVNPGYEQAPQHAPMQPDPHQHHVHEQQHLGMQQQQLNGQYQRGMPQQQQGHHFGMPGLGSFLDPEADGINSSYQLFNMGSFFDSSSQYSQEQQQQMQYQQHLQQQPQASRF
mmetsp:Transcript_14114/g.25068  ORF Transcript_14114/g.25068 Transcript_14114/m.25068 type:complete len:523 (+) Transcript_14114:595-2163(+)|eukprot:CAMPEP_0203755738 /NCGR_PEP_ID=MMETSP0098-20131031/9137_1 /ASSEMBLY_ACC=CAM_ASM_000208 /TAXON_ID=96639 /ORGANISM=" , Strain NY0313808BC1" /LENGTH=522 /DNA_ID=CAMNT_0050647325 /DNA_START=379 /DNA_END=1947 /DNA_ORIENTATION=+